MLVTARFLTELPPKLNLKSDCESLLLGIMSGMSCESGKDKMESGYRNG